MTVSAAVLNGADTARMLTATALVIGGYAVRVRFRAVLWFSALWLLLVYVPLTHWVWGGGAGYTVQKSMLAQMGVQALGIGVTMLWCGVITWLLRKLLDATQGLRVSEESESEGPDLASHGERGYNP
jgi:ammonia channel protein AmtB